MNLPQPPKLPRPSTIPATPESLEVDLNRTTLIVVDVKNSVIKKGGMFDMFGWNRSLTLL